MGNAFATCRTFGTSGHSLLERTMNIHKLVAIGATASLAIVALAAFAGRNYGPFHSGSTDSGTCGNDWANDTYDRYFHVDSTPNANGTYTVTEDFRNGSFVTIAGASPGSCGNGNGNLVNGGIQGHFQGTFTVIVSNGTYNPNANTSGVQTTTDFVHAVFGAGATYDVPTFNFNYNAGRNGEWKNASADRGGNHGDIYSISAR